MPIVHEIHLTTPHDDGIESFFSIRVKDPDGKTFRIVYGLQGGGHRNPKTWNQERRSLSVATISALFSWLEAAQWQHVGSDETAALAERANALKSLTPESYIDGNGTWVVAFIPFDSNLRKRNPQLCTLHGTELLEVLRQAIAELP